MITSEWILNFSLYWRSSGHILSFVYTILHKHELVFIFQPHSLKWHILKKLIVYCWKTVEADFFGKWALGRGKEPSSLWSLLLPSVYRSCSPFYLMLNLSSSGAIVLLSRKWVYRESCRVLNCLRHRREEVVTSWILTSFSGK